MLFAVFADGSANLPRKMLEGITLLPCEYSVDGVQETYLGDVDHFDGHAYYERLRNGGVVQTSLLNTHLFLTRFAPALERGLDVIYVAMSSGISGTYHAAKAAARELMEQYKGAARPHCGFPRLWLRKRASGGTRGGAEPAGDGRGGGCGAAGRGGSPRMPIFYGGRFELFEENGTGQRRDRKDRDGSRHQADPVWGQHRPHCFLRQGSRTREGN